MSLSKSLFKLSQVFLVAGGITGCQSIKDSPKAHPVEKETTPSNCRRIQTGIASYYGEELAGNKMANGKPFRPMGITFAHKTLPLGTTIHVKSADPDITGSVTGPVTDRGPYIPPRVLDASKGAAAKLGFVRRGTLRVHIYACNMPGPQKP